MYHFRAAAHLTKLNPLLFVCTILGTQEISFWPSGREMLSRLVWALMCVSCPLYTDTCPNSLNLLVICPLEEVFTILLWWKLFWLFFIWKHLSPWRSTETSLISLQPEQNHAHSAHTIHCTCSSIYYSNNYLGLCAWLVDCI